MKERLKMNLSAVEPYVRLVQKISGSSEDYYVPWRILYDFELILITKGNFRIYTDADVANLVAGELVVVPPFLKHKQEIPAGCECSYYAVHLDFYRENNQDDFSYKDVYILPCENHFEIGIEVPELDERRIYEPENVDLSVIIKIKDFNMFYGIFKKLYESYEDDTDISRMESRAYAMLLLGALFREIEMHQDDTCYAEKMVKMMAEYMSRHFSERVDLVAFSQQYGFTPNYFRKIFRQILNCPPNEYLINIRLEEAKKLLELGSYTVQTVSEMVGYNDLHYFSRLFKKKEGISPAKFRGMVNKEKEVKVKK